VICLRDNIKTFRAFYNQRQQGEMENLKGQKALLELHNPETCYCNENTPKIYHQ
jgi:hypothetical protein